MPSCVPVEIVDVRGNNDAPSVTNEIIKGLSQPSGERSLPTLLLYDERGLRLYDDITTHADAYYLFSAEEDILKQKGDEIVDVMRSKDCEGEEPVVLELGAGSLRKTSHILRSLSKVRPELNNESNPCLTYYALDLDESELERTLGEISMSEVGQLLHGRVATKGILGTYDEGLSWIENGGLSNPGSGAGSPTRGDASPSSGSLALDSPKSLSGHSRLSSSVPPLHLLFLGSSVGNFTRKGAAEFLASLPLRPGSSDTLLLGLDHANERAKVEEAYDDKGQYTRKFIMNGLRAAGRALGDENKFNEDRWEYVGRYNEEERRHEAYYRSKCDQRIEINDQQQFAFLADELLKIEVSVKYSDVDAFSLFAAAQLRPIQRWTDAESQYSLWLLERPAFVFPTLVPLPEDEVASIKEPSPFSTPTFESWQQLWSVWDFVTMRMIPDCMLHQRPIDLRHICLFYLGHIPAFLDIFLDRFSGEEGAAPKDESEEEKKERLWFHSIFERGIDPDVDDPTRCHPHSEVPTGEDEWPALPSILGFQSKVRDRVEAIYTNNKHVSPRVGRVLSMTYEHEGMHLETLLYMLLQRAGQGVKGTLPPPGFVHPPWESLAGVWDVAAATFERNASKTVTLGPAEVILGHNDLEAKDSDNSYNSNTHEYGWDNENPKRVANVDKFKISLRPVTNGEFYEFYKNREKGKYKVAFPASWIEEAGETKVRTLYGPVPMKIARHWPVMATYDDMSTYATVKGGRLPTETELKLFLDKFECGYEGGANVGLRNWHPIPATTGGSKEGGKGTNGGVWEWTSTTFDKHEGFVQSELYPGYSTDFFDGRHQVVLGGSYATIPRLASRRSMRNWYQKNYPYAWIGGRIAYDI